MGVKSTVRLTRAQAVERYVDLKIEAKRRKLRQKAAQFTDEQLEDEVMRLNDEAHDGEGFENYSIVADTSAHRGE